MIYLGVGQEGGKVVEQLRKQFESYGRDAKHQFFRIIVDGDEEESFGGRTFYFKKSRIYDEWAGNYAIAKRRVRSQVGKDALMGANLALLYKSDLEVRSILIKECLRIIIELKDKIGAGVASNAKSIGVTKDIQVPLDGVTAEQLEKYINELSHLVGSGASLDAMSVGHTSLPDTLKAILVMDRDAMLDIYIQTLKDLKGIDGKFNTAKVDMAFLPDEIKKHIEKNNACGPEDTKASSEYGYGVRPSEYISCLDHLIKDFPEPVPHDNIAAQYRKFQEAMNSDEHVIVVGGMWDWNVKDILIRLLADFIDPNTNDVETRRLQFLTLWKPMDRSHQATNKESFEQNVQAKALEPFKKIEPNGIRKVDHYFRDFNWVELTDFSADLAVSFLEFVEWLNLEKLPKRLIGWKVIFERRMPLFGGLWVTEEFPVCKVGCHVFNNGEIVDEYSVALSPKERKSKHIFLPFGYTVSDSAKSSKMRYALIIEPSLQKALYTKQFQLIVPEGVDAEGKPCEVAFGLSKVAPVHECPYINVIAVVGYSMD